MTSRKKGKKLVIGGAFVAAALVAVTYLAVRALELSDEDTFEETDPDLIGEGF